MILDILKKIKKLKVKELKELSFKIKIIERMKKSRWIQWCHDNPNNYEPSPVIDIDDIQTALTYCRYHFKGNLLEFEGLDKCPCNCHCQNCELIPQSPVLVRMQEIGKDITEENVFNEFVEKYGKKENIGQSGQAPDTNNIGTNS